MADVYTVLTKIGWLMPRKLIHGGMRAGPEDL